MLQKELAVLIDVSIETIYGWERGYHNPEIRFLPSLIQFLGYDPKYLCTATIAEHLKAKRRELGWSQRITAKHLGVDPSTILRWESEGTIMIIKHRKLVASFLGLPENGLVIKMKN